LIEGQEPEVKTFESFNIYPLTKKKYPEVKRVLEGLGYKSFGKEWEDGEDCVTLTIRGFYMTHEYSWLKRLNEPTYTFTEFIIKYSKWH
jgi:hypothetical protein